MSVIAARRTELFDALAAAFAASWRVSRTSPDQIVPPCTYLDSAELSARVENGANFVVVTFPVVFVVDGTVSRQVEQLDDMSAAGWDAALRIGAEPESMYPQALNAGGPTLRAQVMRVSLTVYATTLCAPSMFAAVGAP